MARFVNGTENLENVPLPNARAKTAAKEKAQIFGFGRNEKGGGDMLDKQHFFSRQKSRTDSSSSRKGRGDGV